MLGLDMQMSGYCANLHKCLVQKSRKMFVKFFFYLLTFLQRISFVIIQKMLGNEQKNNIFSEGGGVKIYIIKQIIYEEIPL